MIDSRLYRILWISLAFLLVVGLLAPIGAQARPKFLKFVDDDWDPVQRGRSYAEDPGYEYWIEEALYHAGLDYDVWEVQTDPFDPPQVPPLSELRAYPLVLWNCAAEVESTLTFAERQVLRDYLELGGRVILSGQGILNDLYTQMGNPEVEDFLHNTLGIFVIGLDQGIEVVMPVEWVPYIEPLVATPLIFSDLPDSDMSDLFIPIIESFIWGQPPLGGEPGPASTDRYRPDPIHFQSFMLEAIPDPSIRGDYILYLSEWLGLEGDDLEDLMNDPGRFDLIEHCPSNDVYWSADEHAFVFASWGSESCQTVWEYLVRPDAPYCDWRMGFSHRVDAVGENSEMVLMELKDDYDRVEISILEDPIPPGDYAIHYVVEIGGDTVIDTILGDMPAAGIRRSHLRQRTEPSSLDLQIMDVYGNILHELSLAGVTPDFNHLLVRTVGSGLPSALPITGWIDDYFFEGCLALGTTAVDAAPAAAPLLGVHPNPFNPSTRISVSQRVAGSVDLAVYDLSGRQQRVLLNEVREAGRHELSWDGRDARGRRLPSGVYLLGLRTPTGTDSAKLVLLK